MAHNLTRQEVEKIQIEESVNYINFGLENERMIGVTRGGSEFTVTNTIRDIEHDGRKGKTKGLQVVESQEAKLKLTTLTSSQENIALAIPGCEVIDDDGKTVITNGDNTVISEDDYVENITSFAKTLDGKYKKIAIFNAMHEGGFTSKAQQKAEGEIALEFDAHFNPYDVTEKIWRIEDIDSIPLATQAASAAVQEG